MGVLRRIITLSERTIWNHFQQNAVVSYLTAQGTMVRNRGWFNQNEEVEIRLSNSFAIGTPREKFIEAFPNCPRASWFVRQKYYVKKFYFPRATSSNAEGPRRRTVHFIAVTQSIDILHMNTEDDLNAWFHANENWFSRSTCKEGEITKVVTKDRRKRRCGMASLLAYFCFQDQDHLHDQSGYQILDDTSAANPWNNGNMPNLRAVGGLNFNNIRCNRIFYVRNHHEQHPEPNFRARNGNKAFIYAARASGYQDMVAYNPTPCNAQCCLSHGDMGTTFHVRDIISGFNRDKNPHWRPPLRSNPGSGFDNFAKHYGNDWYFCRY